MNKEQKKGLIEIFFYMRQNKRGYKYRKSFYRVCHYFRVTIQRLHLTYVNFSIPEDRNDLNFSV